ncbi:MAG: methyltransferase domain-containing protein [Pseudomonadota bacterium]
MQWPRVSARASHSYDAAAWLQTTARAELLSRLTLLRAQPRAILDLGAGTGLAAVAIKRRFRRASVTAVDVAAPMLEIARRAAASGGPFVACRADARELPFEDASFDLVFSNMMLQWLVRPMRCSPRYVACCGRAASCC